MLRLMIGHFSWGGVQSIWHSIPKKQVICLGFFNLSTVVSRICKLSFDTSQKFIEVDILTATNINVP